MARGVTPKEAGATFRAHDSEWVQSLTGFIDAVLIDEAHVLRHEGRHIGITIEWLSAKFHLLISATIITG